MKPQRALRDRLTWISVGAAVLLIGISLLLQGNADWYSGDHFYDKQVIWFLVGGIVFVIASVIDLRLVERSSYFVFGACVALLIITLMFAESINQSKRWLEFGAFNLQASELTKLGVILALARYYHGRRERVPGTPSPQVGPYTVKTLLIPGLIVVVPVGMVLIQPDLGTALVILLVAMSITLFEGVSRRTVAMLFVILLVLFPVAWKFGGIQEYQKDRVWGWMNPAWLKFDTESEVAITTRTLQSEQALWAIGSGEFWGHGSRGGAQSRLKHLAEMHTDMIMATFAEEQGFIGCTVMLLLFWLLVIWALRTAHDSRDRFCTLVAVGVASMIGWQVFINIGMVSGLLPIVGLPLPLVSYGGSMIVVTMASLGLVLNVAFRRGRL